MSPADAKRGAKRRKNKRGGSAVSADVKAAALRGQNNATSGGCAGVGGSAGLIHSPPGNCTPSSPRNEIALNGSPFTDGPLGTEFSQVPQVPFTFGLGQRAPYTTGDHCLLCRSERKDTLSECGTKNSNKLALSTSPKSTSKLHLPLWVCSDCRRTVENEEIHTPQDQSLASQDFLLHMPPGNSGSKQETVGGGRMLVRAQTIPSTVALNNSTSPDIACSCDACNERREISAETERESQQLQNYWSDVRYMIRCIYRQAGTPLADDQDQSLVPDKDGMKDLVDRLCERDPYQLYQRLEQQAREYVLEMKVRLLKHLSIGFKVNSTIQGPPQAHQFISLLLEEYSALCQAACTIGTFLVTLENEHLKKFQVTWELHNKHLFENLVFSEPLLQNSLPALVSQLRLGTASHDSYSEDMYSTLLQRYHQLEQEMNQISEEWLECQKRIDNYVDEQMALKTKQRMLKEDWEFFKQRRFIEEQLNNKKTGENNFTDKMRHMLSTRMCMSDCPNCNYRRRCTCDDCSLSHILTCGIMDTPLTDDIHLNQLPLQVESTPDYLSAIHPPSMSSASSESGSSSPITIQQHPRLILAGNGSAPTFGSDDEDGAPLSAKFADIYPLNNYDDADVVANMNGIHSELNGGGENMALKDESPVVSSTSSSSSEADDEEADGESCGEQPEVPEEEHHIGKRSPRKEGTKIESPPPSYISPQMELVPNSCECHVCKQEASGLSPSALVPGRIPAGHQFMNPEKPAHPALHLYPHIHGHLPLHTIPHLPRPLIHPTLYASPFAHNKALPPNTVPNHTSKHQAFNASLQDHIYPSCFGNSPEWNRSKFISLWGSEMMNEKNWNPATFLPDPLAGGEILGPALPEIRPEALPAPSSNDTAPLPDIKERKNSAKKKCLYNFQDAFIESDKVVMATSSATSSVSCTATTVQSSSNQFKVSSKRPSSIGEVFHNIKDDHRHPSTPVAPRNSPTSLATLPSISPGTHSSAPSPHIQSIAAPSFPKTAATAPGFVDPHLGFCPSTAAPPTSTTDSNLSAPPSVCSDPDCEGHRCENNGAYDHQQYDGEESQDEDSCSEHSSSTSTSTNQKEGKYCDCCYCEFFGHGGPPSAPTSRNYAEMREKLRLRLTKRKEEQPKKSDPLPETDTGGAIDHRKVDDLVHFINSSESKPVSSSRAAKRARHKQRKEYGASPAINKIVSHVLGSERSTQGSCSSTAEEWTDKAEAETDKERLGKQQLEEKARQEAEAREQEELQLLEEQREEEERLQKELQRHQECHSLKKKKKERSCKDSQKVDRLAHNPLPNKEPLVVTSELVPNGTAEQPEIKETLPVPLLGSPAHRTEPSLLSEVLSKQPNHTNGRDFTSHTHKEAKAKHHEQLSLLLDLAHHKEYSVKQKPPKQQIPKLSPEQVKKSEASKFSDAQAKVPNHSEAKVQVVEVAPVVEQKKEEKKSNGNNKKQPNHFKDEKIPAVGDPSLHSDPPQNNKLIKAESPQPKGKSKKNKKKKGEKINNSIDDVFLPKDIDLDSVEMDETEREVEYFKRFCFDSARQTKQRLSINWSNFSLKKTTYAAH